MSHNESFSRTRRSIPSKNNDKFALLQNIKKSRDSGTNYREDYKEDDVLVTVDEETYANLILERQKNNIVEDDSEYYDHGKEMLDESDEETIVVDNKRKKSIRNSNIKRIKSDYKRKETNVHEMLWKGASSSKQEIKADKVDFSDLLQLLADDKSNINNKSKSKDIKRAAKPLLKHDKNVFVNSAEKPKFKIDKQKPPKLVDNITTTYVAPPKKSTISSKKKLDTTFESLLPKIDLIQDISMDSWSEETTEKSNLKEETTPKAEFFDLSDIDFDESFENNKGFCESEIKTQAPTVMWDQDNQTIELFEACDIEKFEELQDKSKTQIYWIDAYHDIKIPGAVFLFGKKFDENTKSFLNCCIKMTGLERRLFFLPKPDCVMSQVHNEINSILNTIKVTQSRCKGVVKKYAFQLAEVPDEAEYLMVQYDAKWPALSSDLTGNTFSHVFGCETSILELLILDLKLKGPCWLNFTDLVLSTNKISICKLNYEKNGIKGVSKCQEVLPSPPLTLLSINMKMTVNSKTSINEIVSVGCFVHNEVSFDQPPPNKVFQNHFTILTAPKDSVMPYDLKQKLDNVWGSRYSDSVTVAPNERALISNLFAQIHKIDPDLIVGHSMFGHQLQILLQRCQSLDIRTWHRLGRLIRNISLPKISGRSTAWLERMATAGRLICDTEFSGRELVKCRSYELPEMIKNILPEKYHGLQNLSELGDLNQCFMTSAGVKQLIDATMDEAIANIHLMHELQILPLAYQITAICGNLIVRTLCAGKSERNEYLLLHAFTEKDYLTPDKYVKSKESKDDIVLEDVDNEAGEGGGKRKPTYLGGLVLEPKKGFYENFILLMDFNSLYPSIIQELNICFTTIDRRAYLKSTTVNDDDDTDCPTFDINKLSELAMNSMDKAPGILPIEIRKLVESRKQIKSLLTDSSLSKEKKMQLDIRQKALKITANSMYGCLGFSHSRFQATQLASLITCKGREILQKTKEMVESGSITFKVNGVQTKLNLEIVYGDTDSVMVNTGLNKLSDFDTVMSFGKRIKEEVNKVYKHIQIDIDGVFRRLLLLKKKKYAALTISKNPKTGKIETKQELKGLDIVRRDWCKLAIDVGHKVVTKILEGEMSQEDLVVAVSEYLTSIKDQVNSGKLDLDKFVITKGLARNPETYTNALAQAHVQVALRHNKSGATRKFRAQDTVEYVICDDGTTNNATQRAYSPGEVRVSSSSLKIDTHYYLSHQLHPVISRLVDGIEGLNPANVAESLGLDPKGYVKHTLKSEEQEEEDLAMSGADKYKNCKPLSLVCLKCRVSNELSSPITSSGRVMWPCVNCKQELVSGDTVNYIRNVITKAVVAHKRVYYSNVSVCQDLLCGYKCRQLPIVCQVGGSRTMTSGGQWLCPRCGQGPMRPVMDHGELYHQIMYYRALFSDKRRDDIVVSVRAHIDQIITRSAYCTVDFGKFAAFFRSKIL